MTEAQANYQLYLESDHWKQLRSACWQRDGFKCRRCKTGVGIQAHHVRYRWPWESGILTDVITLCRKCHEAEHGLGDANPVIEIKTVPTSNWNFNGPRPEIFSKSAWRRMVENNRRKLAGVSPLPAEKLPEPQSRPLKKEKRWKFKKRVLSNVNARVKRLGGYPDSWKFKKRKHVKSIWRTGSNPGY